MRILIQRVRRASVSIGGTLKSAIGPGLLVFVGIEAEDGEEDIEWLAGKLTRLRIFDDENGVMNLDVRQVGGEILVVSQFTLYANCKRGNRPSFTEAGAPDEANRLYEYFVDLARRDIEHVATGSFGAMMQVELVNETATRCRRKQREENGRIPRPPPFCDDSLLQAKRHREGHP